MGAVRPNALAVVAVALMALAGCSERKTPETGSAIEDIAPKIEAWEKANGVRVGPTALRLRDGSCLDLARLPQPWTATPRDRGLTLTIAASGDAAGVASAAPLDGEAPGQLRIWISGWSRPPGEGFGWRGLTPERIKDNIDTGIFRRVDLWPPNALSFKAYLGPGDAYYFADERGLSQCRDYGPEGNRLRCAIVSADEQYIFGGDLARSNMPDLPARLQRIGEAIEAIRGVCPTEPSPQSSGS
jgi:hypothetical protein